jgi:hypothetical protein
VLVVVWRVRLRGRVALRPFLVPEVIARLLVRRVGVEGREVGLRVQAQGGERYLQLLAFLVLYDDVRNLSTLLVGDHVGDPAQHRPVRRPRLQPYQTSLFHALSTSC